MSKRLCLAMLNLLAVASCVVACGKKDPVATTAPDAAKAVAAVAPGVTAGPSAADQANLAKAAAAVRCQLTGYATPNAKVYTEFGFASAEDYATRWQAAAKADPAWAQKTLVTVYATLCPGQRPVAPPAAPTPAAEVAP